MQFSVEAFVLNDDVEEDEVRVMPQVEVDLGILFLLLCFPSQGYLGQSWGSAQERSAVSPDRFSRFSKSKFRPCS